MQNATYILRKHRVYRCACGNRPSRPLQASDTRARPYPVPCELCGRDLSGRPYVIVDTAVHYRNRMTNRSKHRKRWRWKRRGWISDRELWAKVAISIAVVVSTVYWTALLFNR